MSDDRIIYAEEIDGTFVAASKATRIMEEMKPFLDALAEEMREKAFWKKQPSWAYRVKTKLNSIMRKYMTIPMADAVKIQKSALAEIYVEFIDLVTCINEVAEFIPSKQDFCAYAQIPVDAYNDLLANGDDDQRLVLREIDSYLSDLQIQGAQGGIVKERSTEFRMTAQDFGHSIVKKPNVEEAADVLSKHLHSPEYWIKTLGAITPPTIEERKGSRKK